MDSETYINYEIVFAVLIVLAIVINIIVILFHKAQTVRKIREIQSRDIKKKILFFKSVSEAEERERERIARNLHDEINLMLAVHKQVLEKHAFDIKNNCFSLDEYYKEIGSVEKIREAVTACATNLIPAFLIKNGLAETIEDHVRHINQAGRLKARTEIIEMENISQLLGKQYELNIYRICLELINNLLKHADPKVLNVRMFCDQNKFCIEIDHDGKKVSNDEIERMMNRSTGLGLRSIQARCILIKAVINYSESLDRSAIAINVPFPGIEKTKKSYTYAGEN
jgi:signal transduction histidine kinase